MMIRYLLIPLFFTNLFSQIIDNQIENRIRQDIMPREQLAEELNHHRDEHELLQFIESTMENHLIPGISISIVKDQNIVWEKHFGYSNINQNILVDENTLFMLASISKTITATALMQLFEDGLFSLNDNINNYLPFNVNHPDYLTPITFKMLLTHTSGIKDNWGVMPYYDGDSDLELGYYLEQYFNPGGEFYNSNSNFIDAMPGTYYDYSNIGAALIGLLVEEISNQPFNDYCHENIFEPLSMDNTYWFLSEIDDVDQIALPYQTMGGGAYVDDCSGDGDCCLESWIGDGYADCEDQAWDCDLTCYNNDGGDCGESSDNPYCGDGFCNNDESYFSCPDDCPPNNCEAGNVTEYQHYGYSDYPSGQLRTTSNSLAKFMGSYINNGIFNGNRILEAETVEMIKSIPYPNINSGQGLIWYYKNANGRNLFGHNGGDTGVSTEMFISTSNNLGVIILSNSSNYNALIQIENAVFDFAEETDFTIIGDINSDGIINILDVVLLINNILSPLPYEIDGGDLNDDGTINILDVVQLVNIILN